MKHDYEADVEVGYLKAEIQALKAQLGEALEYLELAHVEVGFLNAEIRALKAQKVFYVRKAAEAEIYTSKSQNSSGQIATE